MTTREIGQSVTSLETAWIDVTLHLPYESMQATAEGPRELIIASVKGYPSLLQLRIGLTRDYLFSSTGFPNDSEHGNETDGGLRYPNS